VVPAVATADAAFAAAFTWGPENTITSISSENQLVATFGKPDTDTAANWLTAASFLAYAGSLNVIRTVGATAAKAADDAGNVEATYSGERANGITVNILGSGDVAGASAEIKAVIEDTPAADELSVVVTDTDGSVLEVFQYLSTSAGSTDATGGTNFIDSVLNQQSNYVNVTVAAVTQADIDGGATGAVGDSSLVAGALALANGVDDNVGGNGATARIAGYALLDDPDAVDVSLIFVGTDDAGTITQAAVNIAESRKDCVVFSSAPATATSAADVTASSWYTAQSSSSYLIMDSGYKKMYDRYNDDYVNVPLNGDIAGLCVFTDETRDPWFSPAGINRGTIKNVVNLLYSPTKGDRDDLYKAAVNPVASFTGQGTVLFGDKTFLKRPSSFDRINVRRLMIFLEKMIGRAARSLLFEFNDEFTRSSFVNMVTPTLRDVQGRRGISDFLVICDESNNTADVIDNNQFVGSILVKPNRSINYIQLNFVAVRTGVEFSEVAL
jgi:phage tail sheath protein FI